MRPLKDGDEFRMDLRSFDNHLYADVRLDGGKAEVKLLKADVRGRKLASIVRLTPEIRTEIEDQLVTLGIPRTTISFASDRPPGGPAPEIPGGPKNPPRPPASGLGRSNKRGPRP